MRTELDACYEILLERLSYDGRVLTVVVSEQFVQQRNIIAPTSEGRRFKLIATEITSYLVVEEVAALAAGIECSDDSGFLRRCHNQALADALGLNILHDTLLKLDSYALITSHETIMIFTKQVPDVVVVE